MSDSSDEGEVRLPGDEEPIRPHPRRIATMQDIATASGVSQSTVSRVLTGAPTVVPINPATRQRVLEIARQMRYRPNPLARGLRGARTMLLGVIVREITDPFFPAVIDAVSAEAAKRGYNVVLGHAHGRADEAIALRAILETRHCDAILLLGDIGDHPRLLEDLHDTSATVVAAWQGSSVLPGIPTVNVDNRLGMNGLVDHLVGLGHRTFGFIGGGFIEGRPLGDIRERRVAFLERLAKLGIKVPAEYLRETQNTYQSGAAAFQALLELPTRPTAIVASTDVLAIGALHSANVMGLRVPDDVSVTGFDDLPISEYMIPPLTTARMPIAEMAAVAVGAAIDENSDPAPVLGLLTPTLVVRRSSGPVPQPRDLAATRPVTR
jgi:DNA-binding LacI/PurR family transcriptional regulator